MPDWYSWKDLLHRWNKKDFELLEYLNQELQPYSKYGQLVNCPQFCLPEEIVEKLSKEENGSTTDSGWHFFTMPSSDDEIEKLISLLETTRFKLDNVLEIEKKTGLYEQTKIPLKWLNGCYLMEKWGIDTFELGKLIFEYDLPAYDSITLRSVKTNLEPREMEDGNHLTRKDFGRTTLEPREQQMEFMARIRFKLHEVEIFEKEYEDLFGESELAGPLSVKDARYESERLKKEMEELKSYIKKIPSSTSGESIPHQTSDDQIPENYFRNKGDFWKVMFDGKEVQLRNLKRFHYIIHLLERPNKDIGVDELDELVNKADIFNGSENQIDKVYDRMIEEQLTEEGLREDDFSEPEISHEEIKNFKNKMELAYENLKYAKKEGDPKIIQEKQEIVTEFIKYCRNYYGVFFKCNKKGELIYNKEGELEYEIKKRPKKERDIVRSKIKMNIKNTIKDLEDKHKLLAEHLDRYIDTGSKCTYRPPDGVDWHIVWRP